MILIRLVKAFCCLALFITVAPAVQSQQLSEALFREPASHYGIRCWWWWLNGNVTKQSITRDLEAMKDKGFSGACIFDAGGQDQRGNGSVPEGPLFGSPPWQELFRHAVKEAKRLGLVLSLNIQSGWNLGAPDVQPQEAAKRLTWSETIFNGNNVVSLPLPPATDHFYRDIAVLAFPLHDTTGIKPIHQLRLKAAFDEVGGSATDTRFLLEEDTTANDRIHATAKQVIDISRHMDSNGQLSWKAPPGKWVLLRIGYTLNGAEISTASGKWQGHVVDYMSKQHFTRYWDTHVKPLLESIGTDAGTTLRYLQTDSWEVGGINWTEGFEREFRTRRGYDMMPYLPVIAGKIINSRDASNRFLADLRKTISDCIADNHYKLFQEKAGAYGMGIQPESAGPHAGPFDGLKNLGHSEIMMGEFWSPSPHRPRPENRFFVKQAASAAHIYNKPLVGAEAFTTIGRHWDDIIWEHMKPSFDHELCAGLNLTLLHTFTSSPAEMGIPGQEYFAGTHLNPNITWWKYADAFFRYMARAQYMMQQGRFVADVLYYYGDHVPNIVRLKEDDPAGALPGFDYDVINEERLLALQVQQGRIVLPHGMSYRVLVLPAHKILSLAALRKVYQLLQQGATVIGPRTQRIVSLEAGPAAQKEPEQLTTQIWGRDQTSAPRGSRQVGKGRIAWGYTAADWLTTQQVAADCHFEAADSLSFGYIHHRWKEEDYYFVSSRQQKPCNAAITLRVSGRLPEFWDPVTGNIQPAVAYTQSNGTTTIPVSFAPYGAWFIVFRKPVPTTQSGQASTNTLTWLPADTLRGPWELHFEERWGGPASVVFPALSSWTERPEEGIRYYSGSVVYHKEFTADPLLVHAQPYLNLGIIKDVGIAHVTLNGHNLGVLWTPPYRIPISGMLREGNNVLEVEVINSWRNRLVGDRDKPAGKRFTRTNIAIRPEWQLLESGLLGPVVLETAR
jgi:alpha-L-rhamnosidase